jgi:hypothetical protein
MPYKEDEGGKREMYTGFWWGNLKERDNVEATGIGGMIIVNGS